ncbi:HK97-gp10 family putative phage morphogenesis protein [Comamonas testosteroni]
MFSFDANKLKKGLEAKAAKVQNSARPVAQAGTQVLYDQVKINVPVKSGKLKSAIYQVYSRDSSWEGRATYHISWNKKKAPHGHLIEGGTSKTPAQPFLRTAQYQAGAQATEAMKQKLGEILND